jgi:hypothetical protein
MAPRMPSVGEEDRRFFRIGRLLRNPTNIPRGPCGTYRSLGLLCSLGLLTLEAIIGGLIYLIGLIVVVLFILSFLGLR